jgi:hypothetical protein
MTSAWGVSFGAAWGNAWGPLASEVTFAFFSDGLLLNRWQPFDAAPNQAFDYGPINIPLKTLAPYRFAEVNIPMWQNRDTNRPFEPITANIVFKKTAGIDPFFRAFPQMATTGGPKNIAFSVNGSSKPLKNPKTQPLRTL